MSNVDVQQSANGVNILCKFPPRSALEEVIKPLVKTAKGLEGCGLPEGHDFGIYLAPCTTIIDVGSSSSPAYVSKLCAHSNLLFLVIRKDISAEKVEVLLSALKDASSLDSPEYENLFFPASNETRRLYGILNSFIDHLVSSNLTTQGHVFPIPVPVWHTSQIIECLHALIGFVSESKKGLHTVLRIAP